MSEGAMRRQAQELAAKADVVLFCFGLDEISESEGTDRTHMDIPSNQAALLADLSKVNSNVVGILSAGSVVSMPWRYCCKALVHGYLGGQAGAGAMLQVLSGEVNPSGHLAETYPLEYKDTPAYHYYPSKERNSEYREGLFIGYRYYDTAKVDVLYPFGYGLSYTVFSYTDLSVVSSDKNTKKQPVTEVSFSVTNAGSRQGTAVPQVYVSLPSSAVIRPVKELKGFTRISLLPGETKGVVITLDDKAFRYYDTAKGDWAVEPGKYQILVGAHVEDIRLRGETEIFIDQVSQMSKTLSDADRVVHSTISNENKGTVNRNGVNNAIHGMNEISQDNSDARETDDGRKDTILNPSELWANYKDGQVQHISDEEYQALLGYPIPDGSWSGELGLNDALCQMYYAKSGLARLVYKILTHIKTKSEAKGKPNLNVLFIYNMPFRGIAKMTGGMVSMEMARGMVLVVNGHFLKGTGKIVKGFFANRKANRAYMKQLKGL
jgi:beta-glucosidase